ncbi:metalloprotease [Coprinopsis marcescibilis]|uniref:Extracellular metalloproteinase n=1 Tax=Coprinopsis marcescibilis TaxID=230819 RepID=A0A5C3KJT9_COPMA|nr:metalloprotease [Coprinopsis marcescibilis]
MAQIKNLLSTVLLAVAFAGSTLAFADAELLSTRHMVAVGRRGLQVESFNPPSTYETFGEGIELPDSVGPTPLEEEARTFVAERLNLEQETVEFRSGYTGETTRNAYLRQSHDGINFANAVANVAFKDNRVVSFGSSFVRPNRIAPSTPTVNLEDVLPAVEEILEGKYNGYPTKLEYLARPDGSATLAYVAQIQNVEENTWYEAFIDAENGELVSVTDFVSEATYRVLPIQKQAFPEGLELLVNPEDALASPRGWHSSGTTNTTNTSGNNVIAYKSSQSTGLTSQSAAGPTFDYAYDDRNAPATTVNLDSARVNAFYIINSIHDIAYRYGFTETAFNFQNDNFGRGGSGNDRVVISVQDASGTNNANFATPPDGQSGTCRMYIWTRTTPNRDGSLENDIIVHEMGHGITNRMTGGGTGRCLQTTESRGLGEGWSDALAEWTEQKSAAIPDYVLGGYVTNTAAGIRTRPYSTSSTTNPQTYATVRGQTSVHRIGEIWANTLHNVYAALIAQHGWSPSAKTNPAGLEGNIVWLHLFIDALAIQPCNPTFLTARDAWIQADLNRYGGANRCLLWRAFASKGLGVSASNFVDNSAVPSGC